MNMLRWVYPLRFRESFYSRVVSKFGKFPRLPACGAELHFAHVSMPAILPTDLGHRRIAWMGFYELELTRRMVALARPGSVLVDVGANVGYFTCLWAGLNPANEVHAFEPSPRNLAMLRTNVTAQNNSQRIKLYDVAAGRKSGSLAFDPGPAEQSGWGGLAVKNSTQTMDVAVRRLDEVLPADLPVVVLKIDTEGADAWVLIGADGLLRRRQIANVFFEENPERMEALGIAPGTAEKLLVEHGYKVVPIPRTGGEFHAWLD
jgi:FkbM family methyltransferase